MKKTTTCKTKKGIFRFSKMALNHVLIAPEYSRRRELQESYLNIFYLPIFDRFMAHQSSKKNFGPNVRYCFLGYIFALSFWSSIYRPPSYSLALSLCQFTYFSCLITSSSKDQKRLGLTSETVLPTTTHGARD